MKKGRKLNGQRVQKLLEVDGQVASANPADGFESCDPGYFRLQPLHYGLQAFLYFQLVYLITLVAELQRSGRQRSLFDFSIDVYRF